MSCTPGTSSVSVKLHYTFVLGLPQKIGTCASSGRKWKSGLGSALFSFLPFLTQAATMPARNAGIARLPKAMPSTADGSCIEHFVTGHLADDSAGQSCQIDLKTIFI